MKAMTAGVVLTPLIPQESAAFDHSKWKVSQTCVVNCVGVDLLQTVETHRGLPVVRFGDWIRVEYTGESPRATLMQDGKEFDVTRFAVFHGDGTYTLDCIPM